MTEIQKDLGASSADAADRATDAPHGAADASPPSGSVSTGAGAPLKVWWIPQVPMKAFEVEVPDLQTASLLLDTLAAYDRFQFENNVKPDYCNAGGLVILEDGEWVDWWSEDGDDFDAVREDPELLAQAIEARRAATGTGAVEDESAVPKGCAQ